MTKKDQAYYLSFFLLCCISDNLKTGYHYHTKDGLFLFHFDQVLLALQEDNLMISTPSPQVGILYQNIHHLDLTQAIGRALREFLFSSHTDHRTPEEIHINPADYDGSDPPKTLNLIFDPDIKRGYIRVCTKETKEVVK